VSQAIGAVLLDVYFLKPILGLSRRMWWHSVENGSFSRLGIGRI